MEFATIPELMFQLFNYCPKSLAILYSVNWFLYNLVYEYLNHCFKITVIDNKTTVMREKHLVNGKLIAFYLKNNLIFYLKHIKNKLRHLDFIHHEEICQFQNVDTIYFMFSINMVTTKKNLLLFLLKNAYCTNNLKTFNYLLSYVCCYKDGADFLQKCVSTNDINLIKYIVLNFRIKTKTLKKAFIRAIVNDVNIHIIDLLIYHLCNTHIFTKRKLNFLYCVIRKNVQKISCEKIMFVANCHHVLTPRVFNLCLDNDLQGFFKCSNFWENIRFFANFIPFLKLQSEDRIKNISSMIYNKQKNYIELDDMEKVKIAMTMLNILKDNLNVI